MIIADDVDYALKLLRNAYDVKRRSSRTAPTPIRWNELRGAAALLGIDGEYLMDAAVWTGVDIRDRWHWVYGVPTSFSWSIVVDRSVELASIRSAIIAEDDDTRQGRFSNEESGFIWRRSDVGGSVCLQATHAPLGVIHLRLLGQLDCRLPLIAWIAPLSGAFSAAIILNLVNLQNSASEPWTILLGALFCFAIARTGVRRIAAEWYHRVTRLATVLLDLRPEYTPVGSSTSILQD